MSDEKLQILKMVQEGRISPEEAAKLLDAVDQPTEAEGKPVRHVRVLIHEHDKRVVNFVVGAGMVRWVLGLPFTEVQGVDKGEILTAIDTGQPGRVFEFRDGDKRLEIILEA